MGEPRGRAGQQHPTEGDAGPQRERGRDPDGQRAVEALETGALVPDSLITHRMQLEEVGRALDLMAKGEALKVLITA